MTCATQCDCERAKSRGLWHRTGELHVPLDGASGRLAIANFLNESWTIRPKSHLLREERTLCDHADILAELRVSVKDLCALRILRDMAFSEGRRILLTCEIEELLLMIRRAGWLSSGSRIFHSGLKVRFFS